MHSGTVLKGALGAQLAPVLVLLVSDDAVRRRVAFTGSSVLPVSPAHGSGATRDDVGALVGSGIVSLTDALGSTACIGDSALCIDKDFCSSGPTPDVLNTLLRDDEASVVTDDIVRGGTGTANQYTVHPFTCSNAPARYTRKAVRLRPRVKDKGE